MTTETIPILQPSETEALGDVVLLDIRTPAEFSRGHLPGSLSVEYSASGFATRVEVVAPTTERFAIVANSEPRGEVAYRQLVAAGYGCSGIVLLGLGATTPGLQSIGEIWAADLYPDFGGESVVLDVREPIEWETGYVPGAVLIPLGELTDRTDELPRNLPITVICEAGLRSVTAASLLQAAGFSSVAHVPDGTAGYRRTGRGLSIWNEGA